MDSMLQSTCLVNSIKVYSYGFIFYCTMVGQASDSMTALTLSFNPLVDAYCLSLAGTTVAQRKVFFSFDNLFSMFHHSVSM